MNFKGVQTLWEKLDKFTKILSQHGLHNGEFSFLHLYARSWSSNTCVKVSWFENNKGVWIWNSNHTTHIIHTKPIHDFIQASKSHSELLFKHCSYYSDTRDLTTLPPPPNRNLIPRFGRSSGSNRNSEQSHISSLWKHKVQMARTKKVLAFPYCFFFSVVAPFYLEELDCFTPHDTILLIQDFDWVLRVWQVSLEWCHFRQHYVHGCFQALLQLRHVEDIVNSR
jgi:hypothetical protein